MATRSQFHQALLLGASGKLGRALRRIWAGAPSQHLDITPVFRHATRDENATIWRPGDDASALPQAHVIVAFWGVTKGDAQELSENTLMAGQAAELADRIGAARVLHCSSAAVYGAQPGPLSEASQPTPATPYGLAKLEMEQAVARMTRPEGPDHVLMRIGNVAGAESLFGNARPGGTVTLDRFADGKGPRRSYIAPHDLARVVEALALAPEVPKTINVAAPSATDMADLAHEAGSKIEWRDAPTNAVQSVELDTSLLSTLVALPDSAADAAHLVRSAQDSGIWP